MRELPMGQFIMLRPTNIDKVSELTGWTIEDLGLLLERAKAQGKNMVKMPLIPRSLLESDTN